MFDFLSMMGNYEQRKVANTEINNAVIDTCRVYDSDEPYETGITHPDYNNNNWVIVEMYNTKEDAEMGHEKWVGVFSNPDNLPEELKDVSTSGIAKLTKSLEAIISQEEE